MATKAGSTGAMTITQPTDLTVVMERIFDAPRELVYEAYTDPRHIPHWWGPRYLTTTVETLDVRPGGKWRFIQKAADGKVHSFNGVFREVVKGQKLVYTFEYEPMPDHIIVEAVEFAREGKGTKVTVTGSFASIEDRDGMYSSGMESGARESWDRLAELLERLR